jgi:hypothetical protein
VYFDYRRVGRNRWHGFGKGGQPKSPSSFSTGPVTTGSIGAPGGVSTLTATGTPVTRTGMGAASSISEAKRLWLLCHQGPGSGSIRRLIKKD